MDYFSTQLQREKRSDQSSESSEEVLRPMYRFSNSNGFLHYDEQILGQITLILLLTKLASMSRDILRLV